ncbi:hypothetical protein J7J45_02020 [Candidatus Aerophobetes bacterium]|nr:hypothetical protein [Candidatus Aerophobetes bacterium]
MFKVRFPSPLKNVYLIKSDRVLKKEGDMLNEESGFTEKKEIYLDDYIEQIKRKFYQKGFDDGKKHLQDQVLNIVGIFKKATEKLEMEKNSLIKKGEKQLIRVAIAIAKKIIRKEVSVDPEIIKKVVREALQKIVESSSRLIIIRVNPQDWQSIMQIDPGTLPSELSTKKVEIKKDATIQPGGCIVETEGQLVNASIEHQIGQICEALLGEEK